MPKINVLPRSVAELIAAGEVVERPASVVKELVENSIDAGAKNITVEIMQGGTTYIRVTDDGCGISREDVRNAFVSHATSKISEADDLDAIYTLGFRGEALSSVSAVSRTELLTRASHEEIGTRFLIEGGCETQLDDAGCPVGTTIVVRDLFYNTPARQKFLKKDVTEANAVAGVVDRAALSAPSVSFRFVRDGKQTLLTPGDGKAENAIHAVFGKEFAEGLIPAQYSLDGVSCTGFVSSPDAAKSSRSMQFFFLNSRYIKTVTGMSALSEAYKNLIMTGKFPACVLFLTVPAHSVDVNVHPTKTEVRFSNERPIWNAVYYCAKNALSGDTRKPHMSFAKAATQKLETAKYLELLDKISASPAPKPTPKNDFFVSAPVSPVRERETAPLFVSPAAPAVLRDETVFSSPMSDDAPHAETVPKAAPSASEPLKKDFFAPEPPEKEAPASLISPADSVRVLGEAFKTYIIVEQGDSLILLDKHAAHERIIFNRLKANGGGDDMQLLLSPVSVTLPKEELALVLENAELFERAGFLAEDFGSGALLVRGCPCVLEEADIAPAIGEMCAALSKSVRDPQPEKLNALYRSIACRAAVKAGDHSSESEIKEFAALLLSDSEIRRCPHGRPVMMEITRRELEKTFGRV